MEDPRCADKGPVRHQVMETIPVLAETVTVGTRAVETGRAAIHMTVLERDEVVEALLARQDVTIERVPIDCVVTEVPQPRQEGETWVVPIMEERLVIEKQLVLKEELRIRTKTKLEPVQHTVRLREEHVTIEAEGSARMAPNTAKTEGDSMSDNNRNTAYESNTGLYDPALHDNQLVAVYESRARAHAARDTLINAGIDTDAIHVVDSMPGDANSATTSTDESEGFWGAIKNLFAPDDDYRAYHHAIGSGHAMLVVTPRAGVDREHIIQTLESTDPIDFDAKMQEWHETGYGASAASASTAGTASGAAINERAAVRPMVEPTSTSGTASTETATSGLAATGRTGAGEDTIKVVQERLRVGKREVAQGAVRIRSYVVERPVEQQVQLHSENVTLERHPVDRPADPAESALFQERTIEARAMSEEAVVQKEARVVEEIGLRKEATDRTETVRDTVRETKVDVEDQTGLTGRSGTSNAATPGTTSNGGTVRK